MADPFTTGAGGSPPHARRSATRVSPDFQASIDRGLSRALEETLRQEDPGGPPQLDADTARYVFFSDHHRGARNRADDFRKCERAYNAALAYYFEKGYTLVVLGDAEELWEERPARVVDTYSHSLEMEAAFHRAGRYLKIWGNHDDAWRHPDLVRRHLDRFFPGLRVPEGLRLRVSASGRTLGHLFLVHGHQGTADSDRFGALSRIFVRYVWRPFQRLTGKSLNTPARDWRLRRAHDVAMYQWSLTQAGTILVTGHTHRPVFRSLTHAAQVEQELAVAREAAAAAPAEEGAARRVAELAAELEWVRSQEMQEPGAEGAPRELSRPSYFNTGCCSFLDGDITGLEISGGSIRLVRWPDDEGNPLPRDLASAEIEQVFAEITPATANAGIDGM